MHPMPHTLPRALLQVSQGCPVAHEEHLGGGSGGISSVQEQPSSPYAQLLDRSGRGWRRSPVAWGASVPFPQVANFKLTFLKKKSTEDAFNITIWLMALIEHLPYETRAHPCSAGSAAGPHWAASCPPVEPAPAKPLTDLLLLLQNHLFPALPHFFPPSNFWKILNLHIYSFLSLKRNWE